MDLTPTAPSTLPHLAFFEALAACDDEKTPAWHSSAAGLVVLRLFDHWVEFGPELLAPDLWELSSVRESVAQVSAGHPMRAVLEGIVDAIAADPSGEPARVLPRLMAYGRALHYEAQWALSGDVYRTVLAHAHPMDESDLAIDAHMQYGYCMRMLGDWEQAEDAYAEASELAAASGDIVKALRARVAEAKLAMDRGNLPEAEGILEEAIARANQDPTEFGDVRAVALHDRAAVAHMRGEYARAVRFGYQALTASRDPGARDRVLNDIAASFLELGVFTAARDAFVILAATAREQYMRWAATLNLIDIAVRERCEPVFEQHRRDLEDAETPPSIEANYYLRVGTGYQVFGRHAAARVALERAKEIAGKYRFHQVSFEAEQQLRDLALDAKAKAAEALATPLALADVANAIREMRSLAGLNAE